METTRNRSSRNVVHLVISSLLGLVSVVVLLVLLQTSSYASTSSVALSNDTTRTSPVRVHGRSQPAGSAAPASDQPAAVQDAVASDPSVNSATGWQEWPEPAHISPTLRNKPPMFAGDLERHDPYSHMPTRQGAVSRQPAENGRTEDVSWPAASRRSNGDREGEEWRTRDTKTSSRPSDWSHRFDTTIFPLTSDKPTFVQRSKRLRRQPAGSPVSDQGMTALNHSPAITVSVTYDYVWGFTTPNRDVSLTLRTGSTTKGTGLGRSDGVGYFFGSFYESGRPVDIEPGDSVDVTVDGTTTTIEIVNITGVVDPAADTVSGTGPSNSTVSVFVWPDYSVAASTDSSGNYSTDFSGLIDMGAADQAVVSHQDVNGNWNSYAFGVLGPFQVDETYNAVQGFAAPSQSVSIAIADSAGTAKTSVTVTADSDSGRYQYYSDLDIVAGDLVTVTIGGAVTDTTVADLSATVDVATDVVSGTGPAGDQLLVHLYHRIANGWDLYQQAVPADAGGAYTADHSGTVDIRRYDWTSVSHADTAGNETLIWGHPPLLSVNETYNNVWGYAPLDSVVTFTLRTDSTVKETISTTASDTNGYILAEFSQDVAPGDDVDASGGVVATVHVPNTALTALADADTDTVSGTGPASSTLWVRGWYPDRGHFRSFEDYVTSAADETYQDDLSGRYDLYNGYEGHVYYSQADDHKVFVHYHTPSAHVNTTHNGVWGFAPEAGVSVGVTVTNGSGVKATATVEASDTDGYFEAFYDGSVDIAPGDTVEVNTNPWSDSVAIQNIQITADPDTEVVSGTGPTDEIMVVQAWDDDYGYAAVPSDSSGNYLADLSDQVDLEAGDWVRVAYFTDDGNEVYTYYTVPYVRINQSHDWVQGYVEPDTLVTATLLSAAPESSEKCVDTSRSESDGQFHINFWNECRADVEAHDQVQVEAGDDFFDVLITPITGNVDPTADTVCGQMADGDFPASFFVDIWGAEGDTRYEDTTDAAGNYCADYSGEVDILAGHEAFVVYINPDGNQVGSVFAYLRVGVSLIYDDVWGDTAPSVPVSVTVQDGGSYYTDSDDDGQFWLDADEDIAPGDTLIVEAGDRMTTVDIPDPYTAEIDVDTDTVSGTGPAGAELEVDVYDYGDKWVTVEPDGTWSVWFGDRGDLQAGDRGEVDYYTDEGHYVRLNFFSPFLQASVNQSHDWINGEAPPDTAVYVTVTRDSAIVGTGEDDTGGGTWYHVNPEDQWGDRTDIQAGDVVEVATSEGLTASIEVVPMTGDVDVSADTIAGQVLGVSYPADVEAEVWVGGGPSVGDETDGSGNYMIDFSLFDLRAGHEVALWYVRPDGHQVGIVRAYLRVNVNITYDDVWGDTAPSVPISVTVQGGGSYYTDSDDGQFWLGIDEDIAPGDTLIVEAGDRMTTVDIPDPFTAEIDVDTDTVSGTGPAGAELEVDVYDYGDKWVTVESDGTWGVWFGDWGDLRAGDQGVVEYHTAADHEVEVQFSSLQARVNQSHDWVSGDAPPDTTVYITVTRGSDIVGTGQDDTYGDDWYHVNPEDQWGDRTDIQAGDVVEVVTSEGLTASIEVVPMSGDVDVSADTIAGQVLGVSYPADVEAEVWVDGGPSVGNETDGSGNYMIDFSSFDLRAGHEVALWYVRPDGHEVGIVRAYLRVGVNITYDDVWGATAASVPVSVTVQGGGSYYTDSDDEGQFWLDIEGDIAPGDTLIVEAGARMTTLVIPDPFTAEIDVDTDTIFGEGPVGAELEVDVWDYGDKWVTVESDGTWGVWFGDRGNLRAGDQGMVAYHTDAGHEVEVRFYSPHVEVHFRNYDWVGGRVAPNAWVDITLLDESGTEKGAYSASAGGDGWFGGWCVEDDQGDCVDIAPGDTVEVIYDGSDPIVVPVINITGVVDAAANTITGQILAGDDLPADAWTDIWWTRDGTGLDFTTDEFGNFTVDFSPYDVKPGHWVNVWYTNPDGHMVGAIFSELRLHVHISHDDVWGITDPGRTVTVTLRAPDGTTKEEFTNVANEDGQFGNGFSEDIAPGDAVEVMTNPSTSVSIEEVTIDVDVDNDTVCGSAPPDAWLQIGIHGGPWWDLAADESGNYCADFSDEYDIQPGDDGEMRYESPEGHRLFYSFTAPSLIVSDVRTTNLRDTSFTVSWLTDVDAAGEVHYGTDPANLDQIAYDDRGFGVADDTHYVTIQDLLPNTTYYFDVSSGGVTNDNGGAHYTVTTGPTLGVPGSDTVYGQVFKEDGTTPAAGALIFITLEDADSSDSSDQAAPLSALVDDAGYWNANLGNARTVDLSSYFTYSATGDQVRLEAQGAADGEGCAIVDTADDTPAGDIVLNVSVCELSWPIELQTGWNHISLPVDPLTSYTAKGVCTEINGQGGDAAEIDRWYASGWDGHIYGVPFNDFPVVLGSDYFIKGNAASTWTIEGYEVTEPVSLSLQVGWNSIGVPHSDGYSASTLCTEITDQGVTAVEIDRWYASGWDGHICGMEFNDFAIERGSGYFVKTETGGTVIPTTLTAPVSHLTSEPELAELTPLTPTQAATIRGLRVSNLRDTAVTLSWLTDAPAGGQVVFGETPKLGRVAYDVRGPAVAGKTHYVVVTGLEPETTYYFDIVSGATVDDNDGQHYVVTTGAQLDSLPASDTIYGQVFQADGVTPAVGTIVYLRLMDVDGTGSTGEAALMSALVDQHGYWHANLGNARLMDATGTFDYSKAGDRMTITVQDAAKGTGTHKLDTGDLRPTAPLSSK